MSFGKPTLHLKESVYRITFLKRPQMLDNMCKQQYQLRRENKALVVFSNKYTGILSSFAQYLKLLQVELKSKITPTVFVGG